MNIINWENDTPKTDFNAPLAFEMFGVSSEDELRKKINGTRTDLTPNEITCIVECLNEFDDPKYCEIGVYFGGCFKMINEWLRKNKSNFKMFGIDLFEDLKKESQDIQTHDLYNKWNILNVASKDDLDDFLTQDGCVRFSLYKGRSEELPKILSEKCDVFFIDGNHTYAQAMADAEACLKNSKKGTYLIFHNASNNMQPDPQYVARDGGPWAVCENLKERENLSYVRLIDRCSILRVEDV